jgi:acetylglutamate kinase
VGVLLILAQTMGFADCYLHPKFSRVVSRLSMSAEPSRSDLIASVKDAVPAGSVIVVKYGGHAMENPELAKLFCKDVAELSRCGLKPVVVHGGGPQIKKNLALQGVESNFIQGLRVTDQQTMAVAQMVLCGSINKDLVGAISAEEGIRGAIGLCGLDSMLIKAEKKKLEYTDDNGVSQTADLGLVGDPTDVNAALINDMLGLGLIPIIAPVGSTPQGTPLNINADTSAGAVAMALRAHRLLLLTDIGGVLDKEKQLIPKITSEQFDELVADGTISGGMIPKLENAVMAVKAGVDAVSIMDGRVPYSLLRALSGKPFGTGIVN